MNVAQGFVERANVNPVMEMSHMIMIQRAFDASQAPSRSPKAA